MKRRVVVTGMGAITPIGNTVPEFWENLKNGMVGIREITKFDTVGFQGEAGGRSERTSIRQSEWIKKPPGEWSRFHSMR